jgi:hypothetical protein
VLLQNNSSVPTVVLIAVGFCMQSGPDPFILNVE